jgi:hypothetical protein
MRRIVELIVTATLLLLASVSAFAKDTLNAGERLLANQYLQSQQRQLQALFAGRWQFGAAQCSEFCTVGIGYQRQRRLCRLDHAGRWQPGAPYTSAGQAVWATGTNGNGANRATLQDSGNFVLLTASNRERVGDQHWGQQLTPPPPPPPPRQHQPYRHHPGVGR